MSLSKDKIEGLAPDQASLSAALKLMKPASWPLTARDHSTSLLWGECQGSGSTPYRVVVSPGDLRYKCTCPSRKFPCKHTLAVMWMFADKPDRFTEAAPPDWVNDWLGRRRAKSPTSAPNNPDKPAAVARSLDAAVAAGALEAAESEAPADPKALARAAAQRERIKQERETAIREGLDELDRWIADQLQLGLATFAQRAGQSARTLSTRLVDAKAQGIATRLDELTSDVFRLPEQKRIDVLIERLAGLTLIAAAYRRQDDLPPALAADVRRAVGWSQKREDLLADPTALRISSAWMVIATRSVVQPDKLRRLETWLLNTRAHEDQPRFALLLDYVPVSVGNSASPFLAGECFEGEVVYYTSAAPLRAQLASRQQAGNNPDWSNMQSGLADAVAAYENAVAAQPWLDVWPLMAASLEIRLDSSGALALADGTGIALPIEPRQTDALRPMLGLKELSAAFTWDGQTASLLAAVTPIGPWYDQP